MKTLIWTPAGVFVAGMLGAIAVFLMFWIAAPVSAQADTTPPTISSVAITSDPDDDIYEDVP